MKKTAAFLTAILICGISFAQKKGKNSDASEEKKDLLNSGALSGLKFRSIGPALTSGRIIDFAVNPENHSEYYVASASGGVWKTTNAGTTYNPIFDGQGSYSIGCITLDPNNPHVVWVGTGENNNQRSVAYGDGVYKSLDGGKTWKNMGLKNSEHIGKIIVDPRNSNTVYVAAYGPLWSDGGDRGLYKTTDGGKTWERVLNMSKYTGISEIAIDPRNPDVIYAASHQRRRHVWTYISGGPESMLLKSENAGASWDTLKTGLPSGDVGRIAIAIAPSNPDIVYAMVEADAEKGGFFRSLNRGASWDKMGKRQTSGNYYQEIIVDPIDENLIYSMDTWGHKSEDGGKTWKRTGETDKHVDNHALWIDPTNTKHLLAGCDGGIYESWDKAKTWHYKPNLPVTQFYRVAVDNRKPFYYVYGGTQDNFSLGGPSQTTSANGIPNSDWFVTNGGDGFESQIDPTNPDIVYAQAQYGWLVRYDHKSGERIGIKPQEGKGEPALRWNWDAPLIISPHSPTRLYFAANKVFRSDDRGNTWKAVSGDLSRQIDRNKLPVMDKVWSMDAVAKNKSTTIYGNITAMVESPKKEGLIYVGTDDGLIQITGNGGESWNKLSSFPGVPAKTYVNSIVASEHDEWTLYAAFNNHKNGDFKPYLLKSTDKGQSWTNISSNLPKRGTVYAVAEDHKDPNLLFAGTEFGVFFSNDGGKKWTQLKAGLPTIAIKDIAIQKEEDDLVLASFGRGFYVLDNYSALRDAKEELLKKDAHIFAMNHDALMYIPSSPLGIRKRGFLGSSYYAAKNPPVGTTFTYYVKEKAKTLKEQRQEAEKKTTKDGGDITYPSFEAMRAEDTEEKPYLLFTIRDESGNVVRHLKTKPTKGVNRITWDFRYPSTSPARVKSQDLSNPFASADLGHLVVPGKYTVALSQSIDGKITQLVEPVPFNCVPLNNATLAAKDKEKVVAFQRKTAKLKRAVWGANSYISVAKNNIKVLKVAAKDAPKADVILLTELRTIEKELNELTIKLNGDRSLSRREFETPTSISGRVGSIVWNLWQSTSEPTQTMQTAYEIAGEEFKEVLASLKKTANKLRAVEAKLEDADAPWTPGRIPSWTAE